MPVIYCPCGEQGGQRLIAFACPVHGLKVLVRQGERQHAAMVLEQKNKGFPIVGSQRIGSIPWKLIEPHRTQAFRNTGQSLERLKERGGLGPLEAWYILTDEPFPDFQHRVVARLAKQWAEEFLFEASIQSIAP